MTTPRIEEMVENFMRTKGDRAKFRSDIVELVTEAYQAGIDEAVKAIGKQKPIIVNMLQEDNLFIRHGIDGVIGYNEAKKEIIKALQDNK